MAEYNARIRRNGMLQIAAIGKSGVIVPYDRVSLRDMHWGVKRGCLERVKSGLDVGFYRVTDKGRALVARREARYGLPCAKGEIEATGINSKTGQRETIPSSVFKAR
jgi:hypothetical protein